MEPPYQTLIIFLFLLTIFSLFNPSFSQYSFSPPISSPDGNFHSHQSSKSLIAHYIYDLPSQSLDDTRGNSQAWIFHNSTYSGPPETQRCGTQSYITTSQGISNANYFQRTYSDLPFHTFVYYVLNIVAIDSWTSSDSYSIIIDGRALATWKPSDYITQYGSPICGDTNTKDFLTTIIGKITHSANTLTLKIVANIANPTSNPPKLGISNIFLSFPTAVLTTESTQICPNNNCIYNSQTCGILQYEQSGTCVTGCSDCLYPWGTQTGQAHRCFEGFSFNGADCIQCQVNCLLCSSSVVGSCNRCMNGYVLDLDGGCKTNCGDVSSVVKGTGTAKYCIDRCPPGKYMLWDFTCVNTCELPLIKRPTLDQGDFCDYNCLGDGSQYSYWNTSCFQTCPHPYKSRIYAENKFCDLPCSSSTIEFLHEDGTCQATCPEPLVIAQFESVLLCVSPTLTSEKIDKIQAIADSINIMDTISNYGLLALNIIFPTNPGSTLKKSLSSMLLSLRYIDVPTSLELNALYTMLNITTNDYTRHKILPNDLINHFDDPLPPYQFAKFGLHSKFLISYGNNMVWILILAVALLCLHIFGCLFKRLRNIRVTRFVLTRARIILQNYLLGQYYASFGQIFFFSCLDWTGDATGDGLSGLSDTMILLSILGGLCIFSTHLFIIYKYRKIKQNNVTENKDLLNVKINQFKRKQEGFIVLFGDFQDTSWNCQVALFILILRCVIVNLIIALLYKFPPLQGFFIMTTNILVILYFLIYKPFKDPIEFFQQILLEFALCAANSCVIALILADRSNIYHPTIIKNASNGIIITTIAFMCIPLVCLIARIIVPVYKSIFKPKAEVKLEKLTIRPTQTSTILGDNSSIMMEDPTFRGTSPEMLSRMEDLPISEIRDDGWQGIQSSSLKRRLRIKGPWKKEEVVPAEKQLNEVQEINSSVNISEKSLLQLETESILVPVRGENLDVQETVPDDFNELPEEEIGENEEEKEEDEDEGDSEMEDGVLPLEGKSEFIPVENEVQELESEVFPRSTKRNRDSCLITSFGFNE